MGWIQDLLKDVPISEVLRERVALAEDKLEAAEVAKETAQAQVEALKERVALLEQKLAAHESAAPEDPALEPDAIKVLGYMFNDKSGRSGQIAMAAALKQEPGMLKYFLDQLRDAGFAQVGSSNMRTGEVYWNLTKEGRKYAVQEIIRK